MTQLKKPDSKQTKKPVLRRCVGCMQEINKKEAIRVVCKNNEHEILQGGDVCLDLTGKMPGRGAYICKNTDCVTVAQKGKKLERSFKRAIPKEVYEALKAKFDCL